MACVKNNGPIDSVYSAIASVERVSESLSRGDGDTRLLQSYYSTITALVGIAGDRDSNCMGCSIPCGGGKCGAFTTRVIEFGEQFGCDLRVDAVEQRPSGDSGVVLGFETETASVAVEDVSGGGGSRVAFDAGNDELSSGFKSTNVLRKPGDVGVVEGRVGNAERNRLNRLAKKERKLKRQTMGTDWRRKDGGDLVKQDDASGNFWNSTSAQVRQQLIDSKARMHIAENERRERESRDKLAYYDSPEAAMHKAIAMISYAEKQAKKSNDNKVYGWAKTVATSSAESLARSTPDSVPSFDELSAKLEASSQSSFDLSLKAKDDELKAVREGLEQQLVEKDKDAAKLAERLAVLERAHSATVAKDKHDLVVARMKELEKIASQVVAPVGTNVRKARPGMKWVAAEGRDEFIEIPMSYMEMFDAGMKLPVKISENDVRATKSYIRQFGELPGSLQRALDLHDKNKK